MTEPEPLVRRLLLARRGPIATYAITIALLVAATLLRWAIGHAVAGAPFLTYYPAIVIATLIGGFWTGAFATSVSTLAAWFLFMPLIPPDQRGISVLIFVLLSAINLAVVAMLYRAVEQVNAEQENLRILIESSPTGIVVVDEGGTIKLVNSSTEKLFGYGRTELLGQAIEQLVPADRTARHRAASAAFFQKPEARPMGGGLDLYGRRKDGSEFPVEVALNPVRRQGKTGVLATVIDITDRIRARDSQQIIVRELRHRTQNLFAVFQALASQSLQEGKTPSVAKQILNGRIGALAQAYNALADSGGKQALLSEIIDRQLAGFPRQVTMTGCNVIVSSSAAQQFALITHELATNALKYGALSTAEGSVSIEGCVQHLNGGGLLTFRWKETGGPPVSQPTRKGFGSVILQESLRSRARSVTMHFDPAGVTYEIQIDLSVIEMQGMGGFEHGPGSQLFA